MTDLDDALESSAPVFAPPYLRAHWPALPPGEESNGLQDSLGDLSGQIAPGGFTVEHSLEDGLPDPVTMTTSNDASGKLSVPLTGRDSLTADVIEWRTSPANGFGSGTSFSATLPSDSTWGDYCLVAIAVDSNTVDLADANADPNVLYGWALLGTQDDGSGLKVWVWGREWYADQTSLDIVLSASASYSWVAASVSARAADARYRVPLRPGTLVSAAEAVSGTSHSAPSAVLDRRGFLIGVWASVSPSAAWTPTGGSVQINEQAAVVDVMMSRTALQEAGSGGLTATTSGATATAVMMNLPLRVMDRTAMNARRYFSPLNAESPLYGWRRDTASVELEYNVVTESGVIGTPLFSGQMEDIRLASGGVAEMPAVSQTRLNLNATNPLPVITRRREGCTIDTLATWLMSRGGSYAGPGPSENTIFWAPFYDSVHPFMDGDLGYGAVYRYITGSGGPFGVQPPSEVPGPFVGGVNAFSNALQSDMVLLTGSRIRSTQVPGKTGAFHDFLSQQNTKGRLTFWVRGDTAAENPEVAANDPARNFLFGWLLNQASSTGSNMGGLSVHIENSNRRVRVSMGQQSGYGQVTFTGSEIPTDGEWHLVGVAWDWSNGNVRVQVDDWTNNGFGYSTDDTILRATDQTLYDEGGYFFNQLYSRLPIADAQLETGPECWSGIAFGDFTRFWPDATDINAVYRRSAITLEAVANPTPVSSWDVLAELARSYLISYRCDEQDRFNWLPLEYFGETEQMTSTGVADTMLNAGELNVTQDSTKTRNLVTLNFQETRVDTTRQPVVTITSVITVPKGTNVMTFSTDVLNGEVHGAGLPNTAGPLDFTLLTGTQIANPATIPSDNYLTVNTAEDGSGSYLTAVSFEARVVGYDSSTVTVRFTNRMAKPVYLANDGQEVPFVRILGYAVRGVEAYTSIRDTESVRWRGERPLAAEGKWVQTRTTAEEVVGKLLAITASSRPEMEMVVVGDPRRKPGQLVTVNDSQETAASGTWRILSVSHNGDGPEYTNTLKLVRVNPQFIWGQLPGWGEAVWG